MAGRWRFLGLNLAWSAELLAYTILVLIDGKRIPLVPVIERFRSWMRFELRFRLGDRFRESMKCPKEQGGKIVVGITALWVIAAILHVTQGIWLSGWSDYLGDGVDGRLNNLQLEHGYQSLLGNYAFVSPGQFAPVEGTIAFSDMHLGTLPLYIIGRFIGLSVEGAFQFWTVGVAALNSLAMLLLIRALRAPWPLVGPLVLLGSAPASLVAFAGAHIQVLPFFAFPLAVMQLARFIQDWKLCRLFYAIGFWALLHLCSPYLGFFGTVSISLIIGVGLVVFRNEVAANARWSWATLKGGWSGILFASGMGLAMGWMYWIYLFQIQENGARSWEEAVMLAPHWKQWGMAPGGHWLYGDLFSWGVSVNPSEHSLFTGLTPWLAVLASLVLVICYRSENRIRWLSCCTFAAIGSILFFTRWDNDGAGIFLWLARHFDGLTAFRASSRSIVIIHVLQALTLCGLLSFLYQRNRSRTVRWPVLAIAIFAAFEGLSFKQRSTSKELVSARRDGVAEEWIRKGGHPLLVFAPGAYNQSPQAAHLDAWAAAMKLGLKTVNGYSGSYPQLHTLFLADPSTEKAKILVGALELKKEEYSLVTFWGQHEAQLGIQKYDTQPVRYLKGFDIQPLSWELSFPIETHSVDDVVMHQFAPIMSARFPIPEGVGSVEILVALRRGAYGPSSNSDGVGIEWSLDSGDGISVVLKSMHFNPRDNPEHRGLFPLSFELPQIARGELRLDVDGGPKADTAWDWFLIGQLKVK